jgi:hypothetical protein
MEDRNRPSDRVLVDELLVEGFTREQVARLLIQRVAYQRGRYAQDDPYTTERNARDAHI